MTPPPGAAHAAHRSGIALKRGADPRQGTLRRRVLDLRAWSRLRFLLDVLVLYTSSSAALFAAPSALGSSERLLATAFPILTLALLYARRGPDERLNASALGTAAHVLGVVSLAAMVTIAATSVLAGSNSLALPLRLWVFGLLYLGTARVVLVSVRRQAMRDPALSTPTLIVGAGVVGEHLVKRLISDARYGLRPVGFLDADPLPRADRRDTAFVPVLGGPDDLAAAIAQTGARHVILAFSSEPDRILVDKVQECQRLGIAVSLVPRLYESINERATLDHIGGLPLLTLHPTNPRGWQFAVKHALDRSFALLALVALAPAMLAIAIAVRLTSPGPAVFRQRRVGRDGQEIDVLKFRTMRAGTPGSAFELLEGSAPGGIEGDDRRTPIGRFLRDTSLDELPQFINVLRGDMSLVGPRPERPEFVERFTEEVARYEDRHHVKSGITGWAQVNGLRGQTSITDRVEWDNYYIRNWSLRLDLRILALTVVEVLRRGDR